MASMREAVINEILLDLQKAYNAMDRYRSLYILEGYGVGPWSIYLLRTYTVWLTMR